MVSFACSAEDIIMVRILEKIGIAHTTYIDIGGHHPVFSNNTYLFYRNGGSGIIVEPNKKLCNLYTKKRSRDECICAGAGKFDTEEKFYNFKQNTRSTFSQKQAEEWQNFSGQKPFSIDTIPILSLDTIIGRFYKNIAPDVISIDAEGYDTEILSGFSWSCRPKIFCIETLTSDTEKIFGRTKSKEIYRILGDKKYAVYAETPANTIFIDTLIQ